MRRQVELGFILQAGTCQILNFAQNPRQSQIVQGTELNLGGGTPHRKSVYREGGTPHIFSEQGTNRAVGTPHILSEQGANTGGHRTSKQTPSTIYKLYLLSINISTHQKSKGRLKKKRII